MGAKLASYWVPHNFHFVVDPTPYPHTPTYPQALQKSQPSFLITA